MIPNKGLQTYTNFGVWGRVGFLEFQYAPEKVYAANEDVPAPGVEGNQEMTSLIALGRNPSTYLHRAELM